YTTLFRSKMSVRIETPIMIGTSARRSCCATFRGTMTAEIPRMRSTLKMLLPTTFPREMSAWPRTDATTLTASSGALVPNATTVNPMTRGEMPMAAATRASPRASASAPTVRIARPATTRRRDSPMTDPLRFDAWPRSTASRRNVSAAARHETRRFSLLLVGLASVLALVATNGVIALESSPDDAPIPDLRPELPSATPRVHAFYYPWYANPETDGHWSHW